MLLQHRSQHRVRWPPIQGGQDDRRTDRIAGIGATPTGGAAKPVRLRLVEDVDDARTPAQRAFDEAKRLVEECGFRL